MSLHSFTLDPLCSWTYEESNALYYGSDRVKLLDWYFHCDFALSLLTLC